MFFLRLFPLLLFGTLLIGFSVGVPASWGNNGLNPNTSVVEDHSQDTEAEQVDNGPLEDFLDTVNHLNWDEDLPHDKEMTLLEALQSTIQHNWDIQIAQQKVEETEAKQDGVESKRILFFFKYFDAHYLEGSAESDVQAQQEHARWVEQQALQRTVELYGKALEATLTNQVAFWQVKQALMQRKLDRHQFDIGQVTAFVLNNSTQTLYTHYQNYLRSMGLRIQAAHALALQVTGKGHQTIVPDDFGDEKDEDAPLDLTLPELAPSNALVLVAKPNAGEWKRYALTHRPDYRELYYRHESVDKLRTASKLQFDRQQTRLIDANLRSLTLRLEKAEQAIDAEIEQRIQNLAYSSQQLAIAQQQQALAQRSLHQAKVSYKAGFSSDKDLVDAQLVYHAAKLQFIKAQFVHFQAHVDALATLGELKASAFQKKPNQA